MPVVSDESSILYYLYGGNNFRWNGTEGLGSSVIVTYSFSNYGELPSLGNSSTNPYDASSFSSFTQQQRNNFRLAANEFMAVSGIILVEVDNGADIDVYNAHGTAVGGYADLPYINSHYQSDVDLVIDSNGTYSPGTYGYYTLLHELGHAVGLDHTHEGSNTLAGGMDTTANTVMSYNYDSSQYGLQNLDFAALQTLYGSSAISAGWKVKLEIDNKLLMMAGTNGDDYFASATNVHGQALYSHILGHKGNDTIIGQNTTDFLRGNRGDDTLHGKGGNDKLLGGPGNDTIYGDQGADRIHGGPDDDLIYGGTDNDRINGGSGNDQVFGDGGHDWLYGHIDQDTLNGGSGNDTLDGGKGTDILTGGSGTDRFVFGANSGHDTITDFNANGEILDLGATGFEYSDLTITSGSGYTRISAGNMTIDLTGISSSDITIDDFVF